MTSPGTVETKVSLYISILSGVAALLANPQLGLGGAGKLVGLVGYAGAVVRDLAAGADRLYEVDEQIKKLVSEGRVPNLAEWTEIDNRLASLDAGFAAIN